MIALFGLPWWAIAIAAVLFLLTILILIAAICGAASYEPEWIEPDDFKDETIPVHGPDGHTVVRTVTIRTLPNSDDLKAEYRQLDKREEEWKRSTLSYAPVIIASFRRRKAEIAKQIF